MDPEKKDPPSNEVDPLREETENVPGVDENTTEPIVTTQTETTSEEITADGIIQLGDTLQFIGGAFSGKKALVYYRSVTRILLLPDGGSTIPYNLPILRHVKDEEPELVSFNGEEPEGDADYRVDEKYGPLRIAKHPLNGIIKNEEDGQYYEYNVPFVTLTNLVPGQKVTTYNEKGEPTTIYTVESVDQENDSAVFSIDGQTYTIDFNFEGIPVSENFRFFTNILEAETEPIGPSKETTEDESKEVEEEESKVEEEDEFVFGEEEQVIEEKPLLSEIPERDLDQEKAMFKDLMKTEVGEADAGFRNPLRIQKNRVLVQQLFALRNDLVNYLPNGQGIKGTKPTSFETVSDILDEVKIPLARPVVNAKRTLYYDHSNQYYKDRQNDTKLASDRETAPTDNIELRYIADNVEGSIDYLQKNMTSSMKEEKKEVSRTATLPKFYSVLQQYFNFYLPQLTPTGEVNTFTQSDNDVFRGEIPKPLNQKGTLDGLPPLRIDREGVLDSSLLGKVRISRERTISSRVVRTINNEVRPIESADTLNIIEYLFFPFLYLREFGSTRTGDLALDMAQSMLTSRSTNDILMQNGPIVEKETGQEEINPDKILPIKKDGTILSNLRVSEWLRGQPIFGRGMGDLLPLLSSMGLRNKELNEEQMKVLLEKVEQYRNAIVSFLNEERQKAEDEVGKATIQVDTLIGKDARDKLFSPIKNDLRKGFLLTALTEFMQRFPAYRESDIAAIGYLHKLFPDALLERLADHTHKEQFRTARQIVLTRIKNKRLEEDFKKLAGEKPVVNKCPHVKQYNAMLRIKNATQRNRLLKALIDNYKGLPHEEEPHWIFCEQCDQHLVCQHEQLLVDEFIDPTKSKQLHKQLILKFSDGSFMGHYTCKNCGQNIQELEYDNNVPYNDNGVPMSSVLVDKDEQKQDEIDAELDIRPTELGQEISFNTKIETLLYNTLHQLTVILGVTLNTEKYKELVQYSGDVLGAVTKTPKEYELWVNKQKSEKTAAKAAEKAGDEKKKKEKVERILDYDIYKNRRIVTIVASILLLEIQTSVPDYEIEFPLEGCPASFDGYPLDPNDQNRAGINYLICGISAIREKKEPWNLTGYQMIESDSSRNAEIGSTLYSFIKNTFKDRDEVQQKIKDKRNYLSETFGRAPGSSFLKEILPDGFVPSQLMLPKDEKTKAPMLEAVAKGAYGANAWLTLAHDIARSGAKLSLVSKQTTITCCFDRIDQPLKYWQGKIKELNPKEPPSGEHGSFLTLPLKLREEQELVAKMKEENMNKLFAKICYQGPRKGYPHEPGYDLTCPYCSYKFPYDPREPIFPVITKEILDKKPKGGEIIELGLEAAEQQRKDQEIASLQQQNVKVDNKTFQDLLDTMHNHYKIEKTYNRRITDVDIGLLVDLNKLNTYETVPFESMVTREKYEYNEILEETIKNIVELKEKKNFTELDMVSAFGKVSEKALEIKKDILARLGRENHDLFFKIFSRLDNGESAANVAQSLYSNFLLPFQRSLTKVHIESKIKVPNSLKLGPEITRDITDLLKKHYIVGTKFEEEYLSYRKLRDARNRLSIMIDKLQNKVRVNTVPGGIAAYKDLVIFLVGGIFSDLLNARIYPRDDPGNKTKHRDGEMKDLLEFVGKILQAMKEESLDFTDKQIREIIQQRDEEDRRGILGRFKKLDDSMKRLESEKKKLRIGDWAVGKSIYTYDESQYVREKAQREQIKKGDDEITDLDAETEVVAEEQVYEADAAYDMGDQNDHEDAAEGEGADAGGVSC